MLLMFTAVKEPILPRMRYAVSNVDPCQIQAAVAFSSFVLVGKYVHMIVP